jgi:alkanesulfonate monooxygenase SsuD/methylene tetrahydromethanopterin reductase-like flavin-dependent oxidoreductase (luciferase family)
VRIGVQIFASQRDDTGRTSPLRALIEQVALAEQLGFDTVWLAEHHTSALNKCTDPLVVLAHLAAVTGRLNLGTAVVNLGLHHPLAVAERALLVQELSGGRLELGIGKGFAAADYQLYDHPSTDTEATFDDHHQRLVEMLDTAAGDCHGVGPPAIWLATSGRKASVERIARFGQGSLLAGPDHKLVSFIADLRTAWPHQENPRIAVMRAVHVAVDTRQACDDMAPHIAWYIDQMARLQPHTPRPGVSDVLRDLCIAGSAQRCIDTLLALQAATGMTDLCCVFGLGGAPTALTVSSMRRFATEVMPALRARTTTGALA